MTNNNFPYVVPNIIPYIIEVSEMMINYDGMKFIEKKIRSVLIKLHYKGKMRLKILYLYCSCICCDV